MWLEIYYSMHFIIYHIHFFPEYFKKYFFWCCFTFPLHAQDTILCSNFCYNLNFKLLFLFCSSLSVFPSFFPSTLLFFLLSFLPSVHLLSRCTLFTFFFLNQDCRIKVYFIFPVSYNAKFSNNCSESAESSMLEKHQCSLLTCWRNSSISAQSLSVVWFFCSSSQLAFASTSLNNWVLLVSFLILQLTPFSSPLHCKALVTSWYDFLWKFTGDFPAL